MGVIFNGLYLLEKVKGRMKEEVCLAQTKREEIDGKVVCLFIGILNEGFGKGKRLEVNKEKKDTI